jgi:poly(3-hydroxybutyrate) depolymerase
MCPRHRLDPKEKQMSTRHSILAAVLACAAGATQAAAAPALAKLGADGEHTSVSGLSSGAFMAVQLQVAFSQRIVGAGIVAGGPYYCAANNMLFTGVCMGQVPFVPPNPVLMASAAKLFAKEERIDALSHLKDRRIYVFSGSHDSVVRSPAVDATVGFFRQVGVRSENLAYVNDLPAGHALISPAYGNDCGVNAAPYISKCAVGGGWYDQAGAILSHIYGELAPRVEEPKGRIVEFDQRDFADDMSGLADTGYLYVPKACKPSARCRVHVAIHGCEQAAESAGEKFYAHGGYNQWADSNHLLVLYPQVNKSLLPVNPNGCWDWWGYTGTGYADKSGPQMKAIMQMVDRLTARP